MRLFRFLPAMGLFALLLSSCTAITTTNIPGKKASKIPKNLLGKYTLQYPESFAALAEGNTATVTFLSDRMVVTDASGTTETMLGDSLFFSSIGKQWYISLGGEPSFTVLRIEKKEKNLQLFPMYIENLVTQEDLQKYFTKVEEVPGEPDENGETGESSFVVTIDDKKLDSFFRSGLPSGDPFILKKE